MWEESLEERSFAGITRDTCTPLFIFRCDARDISIGATIFKRRRYYVRVDLLSICGGCRVPLVSRVLHICLLAALYRAKLSRRADHSAMLSV